MEVYIIFFNKIKYIFEIIQRKYEITWNLAPDTM